MKAGGEGFLLVAPFHSPQGLLEGIVAVSGFVLAES